MPRSYGAGKIGPPTKRQAKKSKRGTQPFRGQNVRDVSRAMSAMTVAPRSTRGRAGRGGGMNAASMARFCALTNPFCEGARGAQFPDEASIPTIGYRWRGLLPLNSDVNGNGAVFVVPSYPYGWAIQAAAAGSATTATTPAAWTAFDNSVLNTATSQYRTISFGVLVRVLQAPLNASGKITIVEASGIKTATSYGVTPNVNSRVYTVAVPHTREVTYVASPLGIEWRTFVNLNTSATDSAAEHFGWPGVIVHLTGATASSSVAEVEFFVNMEHAILPGTAMAEMTRSPPTDSPVTVKVVDKLRSQVKGVFEKSMDAFEKYVEEEAPKAVRAATALLVN